MPDQTPAMEIADSMMSALGYKRVGSTQVLCANEDHDEETLAVARVYYPNARFRPTTACADDLDWVAEQALDEKASVLIEPVEHDHKPLTKAMKDVAQRHFRAYSEPVKAILLEAPDHPHYEDLPDTLEERRMLPARFHTPHWLGDCTPTAWVCAVCFEDGVTYGWPCKTAYEHGGEVFAQ